jgi:hypothetical protein
MDKSVNHWYFGSALVSCEHRKVNSIMVLLNSHLNWSYVIGGEYQVRVAGFAVQKCECRLMVLAQLILRL